MNKPPGPWDGTHVKVFLRNAEFRLLDDVQFIGELLSEIVSSINMVEIGRLICDIPLEVSKLGGEVFEDEGGVSGVIVLSTSHCSIHTWPLRQSAVMDVYSCQVFDPASVLSVLCNRLGTCPADICCEDVSCKIRPPDSWLEESAGFA
jgi:S-adenosylmethionine/arginine decarboxylase-like enzyme